MKKIALFVAFAAALHSCQKPELSSSNNQKKQAVIQPIPPLSFISSDEEGRSEVADSIRVKQTDIAEGYASMRCSQQGPLTVFSTFMPNNTVEMYHDNWGRYCARYTITLTVMANKDCYLPWKIKFIPGTEGQYTYNPPTGDTTDFSIQHGYYNEDGVFVSGDSTSQSHGQLFPDCSYGVTKIISGATRRNGYLSEIKLKHNVVAKIDIIFTLVDNFTVGGRPIPPDAIYGRYNDWLLNMRAAEKLTDPYSKWVVVGNANTPNTMIGQSGEFAY